MMHAYVAARRISFLGGREEAVGYFEKANKVRTIIGQIPEGSLLSTFQSARAQKGE